MHFSRIGDKDSIKFSVVEKIVDSHGREFFVEIKFTKAFFNKYLGEIKKDFIVNLINDASVTNREIEVLKCIAQGKDNNEVARCLNMSIHTAKVHIQNIFKKLSVDDRTAAVVEAIKKGLIEVQ